ncbi:hypothetical protein OG21DRAFT_1527604 [Imleria badia]|nr:hypothetical protein OG21DRAFT_1527604 [Imleria badia]
MFDVDDPLVFQLPFIDISDTAFNFWKRNQLADTEASLTETITNSGHKSHHALANRALVRVHLQLWDLAIEDAEKVYLRLLSRSHMLISGYHKSIKICPSVVGYISKSVALIGSGRKEDGLGIFDLAFRHCDAIDVDFLLLIKAVIRFMAGEHNGAVSRAYMHLLLGNSCMEHGDYKGAIDSFERAQAQMRYYSGPGLFTISLISHWRLEDFGITLQQRICEALYAAGRTEDALEYLLNLVTALDKEVYMSQPIVTHDAPRHGDTPAFQAPLNSATSITLLRGWVLRKWAKEKLPDGSWKSALVTAASFMGLRFTVYRALCEHLEAIDRITDATECFHEMESELTHQTNSEQANWIQDFKSRCGGKLETLGDLAMNVRQHDEAISRYSAALSFSPTNPQDLHLKRSKARANKGLWNDALNDANEVPEFFSCLGPLLLIETRRVITLDPSSPLGYERQHVALRGAGCYDDALHAFETTLSKMSQSSDPEIRERSRRYVNPAQTEATVRGAIENVIRESPLVLINTDSGRLLDKSGQLSSFESQPIFHELVSSMTTDIDRARIEHEVGRYYRYAIFSHKWEDNEPLFDKVVHIVVYDLEESLTHNKLKMFCTIAWSDTCCINKADPSVLQEALVSMFQWYQASDMILVLLRDVLSPSRRGDLVKSIWNTRAWTFQEYHASKVVRFYNKDWTPYRNFDIPNHKESPEIISEMEEATGVSAQALMALRPGLEDICEKLRLASTRQTTRLEDAAYSLLGVFSLSLPAVYGEGDKALGRLLAQLLMSSGDTSILAWTGRSGGFNSCLPAKIAVFNKLSTSHIPLSIISAEMATFTAGYRASSVDLALFTRLYDRLNDLPVPVFVGKRMKLPCIVFKLGPLSTSRSGSERVFRAQTAALGIVEIKTEEDLSPFLSLYLVHPWIDFLLDQQPVGSIIETIPGESTDDLSSSMGELPPFLGPSNVTSAAPKSRIERLASRFGLSFGVRPATSPGYAASLRPPSTLAQTDKQLHALQVIARLRQPFGALLLTPNPGNVAAHRGVASESLITVRVEEITPTILNKLVDSVLLVLSFPLVASRDTAVVS